MTSTPADRTCDHRLTGSCPVEPLDRVLAEDDRGRVARAGAVQTTWASRAASARMISQSVEFLCDRVAVMYLGRIVEVAPREELFAVPELRRVAAGHRVACHLELA